MFIDVMALWGHIADVITHVKFQVDWFWNHDEPDVD